MKSPLTEICALIPARNEEGAIGEVVRGARRHCAEVVVLDDGSRDGTVRAAEAAGAKVIRLTGRGKGAALRKGFEYALGNGFDAVVTLDGDGQHNPDEIPRLALCAEQRDCPLVLGDRMTSAGIMPRMRWFTNFITSRYLSAAFGYEVRDSQCGMRLIRTDLLRRLRLRAEKYDIETDVLIEASKQGVRPCEIPIRCVYKRDLATHGPADVIRFLKLYGRSFSHLTGALRCTRWLALNRAGVLWTMLKIATFPVLLIGAVALLGGAAEGSLAANRETVHAWLAGVGILAPLLFVALCTVKPLTFLPFSGLTVVAGAAFGLWWGTLWVAVGALAGAVVGFHLSRFYGRALAKRFLERRFPDAETWIRREGWTSVVFVRLLNLPWDWVSYAAGLSNIRFRDFMLGTAVAVAPVAFLGTCLGSAFWTFPSPEFFLAFGVIFAFGTAAWIVRRRIRSSRPA